MTSEIFNQDAGSRRSYPEISMMRSLAVTKFHLNHQGQSEIGTHGIIGNSPALESVLAEESYGGTDHMICFALIRGLREVRVG